ncbi:MAG TPA: AAA family ATPase [Acidimicrobiales bacterium]|nr:AAA family ATPase [Acidimicrobiales bacterium]
MPTTPREPRSPALVGREAELELLTGLIDRLALGTGGARTLVGPPGSGKTTLVDAAAVHAGRHGVRVVRVAGLEAQPHLPWAAVAELCLPFEPLLDRVGAVRAAALRCALALEVADGPIDPLAVALGVLSLLGEAAATQPVLLVVDDLQWIDDESQGALGFLGRRLGDDPVALVAASRTTAAVSGEAEPLGGLSDAALRELLAGAGVRSPATQAAIIELADGSPLLARRLAAGLTAEERTGARPLPATLRVPDDVADLYRPLLDQLDGSAREAVAVASADGASGLQAVIDALAELGLDLAALEPAEEAGLVAIEPDGVSFVHPLARTAAYQAMSAPLRRRVHAALAAATGPDTPLGISHRATAAVGVDDGLAGDVTSLGQEALRRGAPLTAATQFVRAAALSSTAPDRADRLVAAARAAVSGGELPWAAELVASARAADAERGERLDARLVDVRLAVARGDLAAARAQAEAADEAFGATDPKGVVELLVEAARPMLVGATGEAPALTERLWALAEALPDEERLAAEVLYGCGRFLQGDLAGAQARVERWKDLVATEGAVAAGPFLAETAVLFYGYSHQAPAALAILDAVEPAIRSSCATGALVPVLCARSYLAYGTDLRACVEAGREAVALSEETGQQALTAVAQRTLAIAAATVGDEALTNQVADLLLASGTEVGEVWARAALARLHLVQDRPEGAVDQFARLRERIGETNTSLAQFEGDEAEAFVRVGRLDDARAVLPALEADAAARGGWSLGQLERVRALLAPDIDTAVAHFEAARDAFAATDNKIALGIAELTWGEWLRRAKRRAEARRHLDRAVEVFGLVGASGLRRRAEDELAVAGGSVDRNRPADELLNPTELHVARLAVTGLTNRDIAGQLFMSPRTVENHLGAVYRKIGVSGRTALTARALADPVLRPVGG